MRTRTSWPPGQAMLDQPALARDRRGGSRVRFCEGGEELVAVSVDLVPALSGYGVAQEPPRVCQDLRIVRAGGVDEAGRPLDVAQQEADGAVCAVAHAASVRGLAGRRLGPTA